MTNSELEKVITKAILDNLIESNVEGADYLFDGKWYDTAWGCDTFDHLRDDLISKLKIYFVHSSGGE